ncbi:MAG: hypothetical protein HXY45_19950 [Syntrophaceae bacterium]|nr:hypothetical protein [Syntrophaceae bacterium]
MEKEIQSPAQEPAQSVEAPPQKSDPPPLTETTAPQQEPILLSKLFPDSKQDLDSLFPDPQMKELLKEIHRTRQGNQRFLKRLNLSKIETEEADSGVEP